MMVLLPVEEARCCYQIVRCERVVLLLATSETSLYTNMPRDMIPAYSILQLLPALLRNATVKEESLHE